VQTFLPYADFAASAAVLDDRRLGKQRVETFQVLRASTWPSYGWKNHPATRMWRGFVPALVSYGVAVCAEWEARGHADAVREQLLRFTAGRHLTWRELRDSGQLPPWIGQDAVHVSHRSALVSKDPEHYRPLFPEVPEGLPYVWPSASFPLWPLRRGSRQPLTLPAALALLGLEEARPVQAHAVAELSAGRDVTLRLPPGSGATTAGLLAGLCTPGSTLWVVRGPLPRERRPRPRRALPDERRAGSVSASIARQPSPADLAAMDAEAAAEPEFRFVRPAQVDDAALRYGAGLVVVDDGSARAVPRTAAVGIPVLRLETVDAG
jgi:hypothetical protein